MIKPRPRPPISPRLQQRLRRLEAELWAVWAEWDGVDVYSPQGRALMTRIHDLRRAVLDTVWAIEAHKERKRAIIRVIKVRATR